MTILLACALLQEKGPVDTSIARAIGYLVAQQDKEGVISSNPHNNQTTMTSLAILAMTAAGHQAADETKEGAALKRGLDYVLREDRQDKTGYFGGRDGSRMYGHGIVTLALAETLGMGADTRQDQLIRDRLKRAVDLILRAQSMKKEARHQGGWRYEPQSPDADLSATVWQVMALRAAKNAGLDVPKEAIDQAVSYIKRCWRAPDKSRKDAKPGACGYQPGNTPEYAMGAAGLLSLLVCGVYEGAEVTDSAEWLRGQKLSYEGEWFFYGTYYYAQGMYQRGGDAAAEARKSVEGLLLPKQGADGSWLAVHGQEQGAGRVYGTSIGVLCLAVKRHFLPIYQR